MAPTAKQAKPPGPVHLRIGGGAERERISRLWRSLVEAHDGDEVAAALVLVKILGKDETERITAWLGHVNAQCDRWRRRNPGAVMAVPRLRLRRSPRRGHAGPRQSRPRARRTTSSASSRGDPDEPEPPHRRLLTETFLKTSRARRASGPELIPVVPTNRAVGRPEKGDPRVWDQHQCYGPRPWHAVVHLHEVRKQPLRSRPSRPRPGGRDVDVGVSVWAQAPRPFRREGAGMNLDAALHRLNHGASTKCEWCGETATAVVIDRWRTVMSRKNGGSGSVFTGGPGTGYAVCQPCHDRLTERYLKARVE